MEMCTLISPKSTAAHFWGKFGELAHLDFSSEIKHVRGVLQQDDWPLVDIDDSVIHHNGYDACRSGTLRV